MRLTSGHTSEDFPHYISEVERLTLNVASIFRWRPRYKEVSEKSLMLLPTGICVSGKFIYVILGAVATAAADVAILHGHKNQSQASLLLQQDPNNGSLGNSPDLQCQTGTAETPSLLYRKAPQCLPCLYESSHCWATRIVSQSSRPITASDLFCCRTQLIQFSMDDICLMCAA